MVIEGAGENILVMTKVTKPGVKVYVVLKQQFGLTVFLGFFLKRCQKYATIN